MENFLEKSELDQILKFKFPRYAELPSIFLYKDQVISYVEAVLSPLNFVDGEKMLTPTMLNNYVKQKIIDPPVKKKYSTNHIAYILVVCMLKQNYSLSDVFMMLEIQKETYSLEEAYDYFCIEFENTVNFVFSNLESLGPSKAKQRTPESELVRSCAISIVHKLHIQRCLQKHIAENSVGKFEQ